MRRKEGTSFWSWEEIEYVLNKLFKLKELIKVQSKHYQTKDIRRFVYFVLFYVNDFTGEES